MALQTILHNSIVEPNLHENKPHNHDDRYFTETEVTAFLDAKANKASPTFTGTPAAPTATAGSASSQLATTQFVSTATNTLTSKMKSVQATVGLTTGDYPVSSYASARLAIQAAVDAVFAAGGGDVYVQPGTYTITLAISLKANVTLRGSGMYSTILQVSSDIGTRGSAVVINNQNNVSIRDIGFSNAYRIAIKTLGHNGLLIERCYFTGTSTDGNGVIAFDGETAFGGVANMDNTVIRNCRFVDTATAGIRLYARNGHTITNTQIIDNESTRVRHRAVHIDAFDVTRNTLVSRNICYDLVGTVGSSPYAALLEGGLSNANLIYNTTITDNQYYNSRDSAEWKGFVLIYGAYNTIIDGNIAVVTPLGPGVANHIAIAPGRTSNPLIGFNLTNNHFEGWESFIDPDSMRFAEIAHNKIINCARGLFVGYGTQEYVDWHHNIFYNSMSPTVPGAIILGSTTSLKKISVKHNILIDDRATPNSTHVVWTTSAKDYSQVEIGDNRVFIPNGTVSMLNNASGGAVVSPILERNEVHDATGLTREFTQALGNVTGSKAIDVSLGQFVTLTLTGNVTATVNSGIYLGQTFRLTLTQDATGSRTITWPSNVKKAGGSLVLSTTAGAVDIVTLRWDGTNWIEVSRSLGVS